MNSRADLVRNCEIWLSRTATGGAREKDFTAAALGACPSSERTTRLLEQTIQNGDFRQRTIALRALERHLDPASVFFLVKMFGDEALRPDERRLVYRYLSTLSEPRWKYALRPIFRQGITDPAPDIRLASVLGLGRIEATEDWDEYLAPLAANADRDLLRTLLVAARLLRASPALELGERHLRDARPEIALAAMELLAVLPGPRAREALLLADYQRLPGDEPSPAQMGRILRDSPKRGGGAAEPTGIVLKRSRLFAEPHDRSVVTGSLSRNHIVYLLKRGPGNYRLNDFDPAGNWIQVKTARGLSGWIHSANLFALPCPPGEDAYCAEAEASPAPPDGPVRSTDSEPAPKRTEPTPGKPASNAGQPAAPPTMIRPPGLRPGSE